ncbi:MAG: TlyA family RNA methyltransferase [Lachnospiraceae bacterium]|nr:TlyA family RNA methyltransferase [Lachnospiraceae bacterium]
MKRIDIILIDKGFATSREKAKAYINNGQVSVNGKTVDKVGSIFPEDCLVTLKKAGDDFVSRGGIKLKKAITSFSLSLGGKVCLDIGASTGGFTDCMLKHGAKCVYAIDSGKNQLADSLKNDNRVINMEETNFRYLKRDDILKPIDFAAADVSFISLKLILPSAYDILQHNSEMVCLIKPQFEAGPAKVGKNGIVKDKKIHLNVINDIIRYALEIGFSALNLELSPLQGGRLREDNKRPAKGNIEYLLHLRKALPLTARNEIEGGMCEQLLYHH